MIRAAVVELDLAKTVWEEGATSYSQDSPVFHTSP